MQRSKHVVRFKLHNTAPCSHLLLPQASSWSSLSTPPSRPASSRTRNAPCRLWSHSVALRIPTHSAWRCRRWSCSLWKTQPAFWARCHLLLSFILSLSLPLLFCFLSPDPLFPFLFLRRACWNCCWTLRGARWTPTCMCWLARCYSTSPMTATAVNGCCTIRESAKLWIASRCRRTQCCTASSSAWSRPSPRRQWTGEGWVWNWSFEGELFRF